jgi:hypothetical protein
MNNIFAQICEKFTPKVNPHVMDGISVVYMKHAEEYVDKVFRSASKSLPPCVTYLGYERATPEEEFAEITKVKNNKRVFDLAKSDIHLVKYKFVFEDPVTKIVTPIPDRYIFLLYVNDAGIFRLGGAQFHITPVLSDKVISPGFDSIFVRLLRDKITFKRCYHSLIIDNVRETTNVIWSPIYRKPVDNKKVPATTKAFTTVSHYLFAKFGFTETFRKFAGFVPTVGENEINEANYPRDQWVICESSQVKPKTYMGDFYEPTLIRLAIPKDKWTPITKALVAGFFYVVDHFPGRLRANCLDTTYIWMILLGHIVFSGLYGENKLYTSIEEHFMSLDDYLDTIIIEKLKENNYHVENFYDLLALILANFNNLVLENEQGSLSMFGKSLEVLYYAMYDITAGIFKVNFRLNKLASKKPLTLKDVIETFNKNMKPGAVFGLSSGKIISEGVSYSGDHKYPKITSKITEQESLPGGARGKSKRLVVGDGQHVDVSMVEAGSVLYLAKSNPTPTNRINPFVNIDLATGTIVPNPKFTEVRERTKNMLK